MRNRYCSIETVLIILFLVSCSTEPSSSLIETAIAQTQAAQPTSTQSQILPTKTKELTSKPTLTNTPTITSTSTPRPTRTPKPTRTPYVVRWLDKVSDPLSKMIIEEDEFTGITWYTDKSSPRTRTKNSFQIYIGQNKQKLFMRLLIQYVSSDWLFIESYSIKADSQIHNYDVDFFDVERDTGGGRIGEWYDIQVGRKEIEMIEAIIYSEQTVIRFNGQQYYDERIVTDEEKTALMNVLAAFEALGGRLDRP